MKLFGREMSMHGEICRECRRPLKWGHLWDCKSIPFDELQHLHKVALEQATHRERHLRLYKDQAAIWEGKFRQVVHENNKLRKKLRKHEQKEIPVVSNGNVGEAVQDSVWGHD